MKQTETVYRCDAPGCDVARPDSPDGPLGILIKATELAPGYGQGPVEAFACRLTHIGPAVRAVLNQPQNG
jgi:hypothetical protein